MVPPPFNDHELVDGMLRGDATAFQAFFDRYFSRVYRFALRRLAGDGEDAKEVAQTTLTKAVRAIASFRGEAALFTWLCQICRREIASFLRSGGKYAGIVQLQDDDAQLQRQVAVVPAPECEEPERQYTEAQTRQNVREILDRLPGRFGDVLEWKYVEGRSVEEIALLLETTPAAAQSILARARNAFRDALQGDAGGLITFRPVARK